MIEKIKKYSNNEIERTKYALSLAEVLSPLECVLAEVNPKAYYNIFKAINRGKIKKIKELEENFQNCPVDLF